MLLLYPLLIYSFTLFVDTIVQPRFSAPMAATERLNPPRGLTQDVQGGAEDHTEGVAPRLAFEPERTAREDHDVLLSEQQVHERDVVTDRVVEFVHCDADHRVHR